MSIRIITMNVKHVQKVQILCAYHIPRIMDRTEFLIYFLTKGESLKYNATDSLTLNCAQKC